MSDQNNDIEPLQSLPSTDLKAKRDEYIQEAQKQKREEKLNLDRERILGNEEKMEEEFDSMKANKEERQSLEELKKRLEDQTFSEADIPDLLNAVFSEDRARQLFGTFGLKKIIDHENVQIIIDANLVPILIKLMLGEEPLLQKEAIGLIKIISAGTTQQVQVIVDKGVIPCLFRLLNCESEKTLEDIIMAIGNIASDNAQFRDMILKNPGLNPLLELVNKVTSKELIKFGTWAISNLCRGRPLPYSQLVESAIPTLSMIFQREKEIDVLSDAAWALSYLSRPETKAIKVLETGIIPSLVYYFDHNDDRLAVPCLRILGNICTLSESQNDVRSYGPEFLPKLFKMIQSPRITNRRETCWLISNITAGSSRDIDFIFSNPYYIDMLVRTAKSDVPEVAVESTWALSNAMKNIAEEKLAEALEFGVLDCFLYLLNAESAKTIEIALEGILNTLNCAEKIALQNHRENEALILLNNKRGVEKLEKLQEHSSREVYLKALRILEQFFEEEDLFL